MKKRYIQIAMFCLVAVGVDTMIRLSIFSSAMTNVPIETSTRQRVVPAQALTALDDASVCCSILDGVKLSIEVQPQWTQDREFLLQVNVIKPVGTPYFFTPVENSYILFVNNHPWETPAIRESDGQPQQFVAASLGSHHPLLRLPLGIPPGAEVFLEWVNYNLRTNQLERLRSAPITVRKAG